MYRIYLYVISVILLLLFLKGGSLSAQEYKVAFNGKSYIGYASDDTPLQAEWKVSRVNNGKSTVIHSYKPISSKDEIKKNLKRIPEIFRLAPYNNEDVFIDTLFSAYKKAQKVGDIPMGQFPWAQFGLGLAFEDEQKLSESFTFQASNASGQKFEGVILRDNDKFQTEALRPKSLLGGTLAERESVFKWRLDNDVVDQVMSAKIYRGLKGPETIMDEVITYLGMNLSGQGIEITVKDTTLKNKGIYAYMVQTFDRFGRLGMPSEMLDYYFLNTTNTPILTTLLAEGREDIPAIDLKWKVSHANELNGIILERSKYSGGPFNSIAVVSANDSTYTDFVDELMEAWYYRVVLIDRFDRKHWSPLLAPAISTFNVRVSSPSLISAAPEGAGILLTWQTTGVEVRGYYIYRKEPGPSYPWQQVSSLLLHTGVPGTLTYLDTFNLKGNIRYEYCIHAESTTYDLSPPSNVKAARPNLEVRVEPISFLNLQGMEDGSVRLSWEDISQMELYLSHYQLGSRPINGNDFTWQVDAIPSDQNFLILSEVKPDMEYTVRAVNFFGNYGSHATPVSLPQRLRMVRGPEYLISRSLQDLKATLRWNPVSDENLLHYVLYSVINDSGETSVYKTIPAEESEITLQLTKEGSTYWVISAVYKDGSESGPSEILQLDIEE